MKNTLWKWLLLAGVTAWSLALVHPFKDKVKLGLDLQGGASFTVQVDRSKVEELIKDENPEIGGSKLSAKVDKDVQTAKDVALEVIRNRVDGLGIAEPEIYPQTDTDNIIVRLPGIDSENIQEATDLIQRAAFLEFRLVHMDSDKWVSELFAERLAPPGYKIPDAAGGNYYILDRSAGKDIDTKDFGSFGFRGKAEFMLMKDSLRDGSTIYRPLYVEIRNQLPGTSLKDASAQYDMNNQPYISLSFDSKGADRFAQITASYSPNGENNQNNNEGRRLAVVMDGTLYSAPSIREPIYGGSAQITGQFSVEEAMKLANALRAGSLKAPLNIIQKSEVDPSLGSDSIQSGIRAVIFGGILVLVFMALYYRFAGVIADLSLLLVMILLPFGMWFASGIFGLFTSESGAQAGLPVLTLPGIAGIVLTIGMAVDANVLIFERIREELRSGKSVLGAITSGYSKAFSTIFDANVTTLLTAAILFWQGSGAIRGFAVTLSAGILVSMLMVLVFTRMFLETIADKAKLKTMKMLTIIKSGTNIDFVGKRIPAIIFSLILIVGTWGVFVMKGQDNFGIDFTGGTSYLFRFEQQPSVEQVREVLGNAGIADATIQYQRGFGEAGKTAEALEIKIGFEEGDAALTAMQTAFSGNGIIEAGEEKIGAQIGAELKKKGITAILVAMVGIIIYISIRFEFSFAVGAIIALLHDVLITVGIYCLCGRQLSLTIIAALLTIVGYSVNDTIVVFDRIREDIKLMKGKASYSEIANLSINQTLSRTLLTSLTTLLTVVMLVVVGGGAINDFAWALLIGVVVGTYSSIFIATPVVLLWHKEKKV
ncbi:protein translocase subunit SecD [Tichowtungia aerotolerans]|uniref:Multifunctional fusion protein n=1 Tax=Tichowtungia aerotolerans TaxID=2697043 RepID=A0A6P1MDK8_9BACT|nr:protein translocase subunit SecD [Tichowtungia aerotolerans]QHI69676.1 protein translocase subunit SecD [Tichowtungia aerotolerans]